MNTPGSPKLLNGKPQAVPIRGRHLSCRLGIGNTAETGPHGRQGYRIDLFIGSNVVTVDRQQGCPGGHIDLVRTFDRSSPAHLADRHDDRGNHAEDFEQVFFDFDPVLHTVV